MRVIFDFDGTLCDITHRRHFVDEKRWDLFFKACVDDEPIEPVIQTLFELRARGNDVQIWSGRSDEVRKESEEWLENQGIMPQLLTRMRPQGDYTPDHLLKEQWLLDEIEKYGSPPDIIFDDRQRVVDMWRKHGIVCAQVAPGDFDKPKVIKRGPEASPDPLLMIMVGPSGAGKDTWAMDANRVAARYAGNHQAFLAVTNMVSSDHHRFLLTGDFKDQSRNKDMWAGLHNVVKARLDAGLYTIVNATNIKTADRKALLDLLPEGEQAVYCVVDRPLEDKLRDRGWRPEWLIEKHHRTMQSNLKAILAGDNDPRVAEVWDERTLISDADYIEHDPDIHNGS